jgi:hypothetical protein
MEHDTPEEDSMAYYAFPTGHAGGDDTRQAVAFCTANGINPRGPLYGSTFEVTHDGWILTREFLYVDGARQLHQGCCGSTHFAKINGKHQLAVKPEEFGFTALLDASGNVAP